VNAVQRIAKPLTSLLLLAAMTATTGCMFSREQLNVADFPSQVASIQPGRSTLADLEALVGPATSVTPIGDKRLHVYTFSDSKTMGFNIIVFGVSKTNTGFDTALFLVDSRNVVESFAVTENSKDLPWQFWSFGD
jgi:hypothetical protein